MTVIMMIAIFAGVYSTEAQDLVSPLPEEAWTGVAQSLSTEQEQSRALDEEMSAFLDTPQTAQVEVEQPSDQQKFIENLLQTPSKADNVVPEMALSQWGGPAYYDAMAKAMKKAKDVKAQKAAAAIAAKKPVAPVAPVVHQETAAEKKHDQQEEFHAGMEDMAALLGKKAVEKKMGSDALDAPKPLPKAPLTPAQIKANKKAEEQRGLALAKHMLKGLNTHESWAQKTWRGASPAKAPAQAAAPQQAQAMPQTSMKVAPVPIVHPGEKLQKDVAQTNALKGLAQMALKNEAVKTQEARDHTREEHLKALHQATQQAQADEQQAQSAYMQQMQQPVTDPATTLKNQLNTVVSRSQAILGMEMIQAGKNTPEVVSKPMSIQAQKAAFLGKQQHLRKAFLGKPAQPAQDQIAKRMEPDTPKPMAAPKPHLKNTQLYKKELDRIPEGSILTHDKQQAIQRAKMLKKQQAAQAVKAAKASAQMMSVGQQITGPNGVQITGEHQIGHGKTLRVLPPIVDLPTAKQEGLVRAQAAAVQKAAQDAAAARAREAARRLHAAKAAEMAAQQKAQAQQQHQAANLDGTPFQGKAWPTLTGAQLAAQENAAEQQHQETQLRNEEAVISNPQFQNLHLAKPKSLADQRKEQEAIAAEAENMYDDGAGAMLHAAGMDDAIKNKPFSLNDVKF